MKVETLTQSEVDAFPQGAVWNAFVHLLAFAEASELSDEQIPAWHAFWYEDEVQNGGHLQYFINRGTLEANAAVASLRRLGADQYADILAGALAIWESEERESPGSVDEYVEEALLLEFEEYDNRFGDARPPLVDILEQHLRENQELFVVISAE